jgi:catechol 2,3-dioxygenase-like lactoylglutathione lyase family enzyme
MPELTDHHVGITVTDIDRSLAFYRDELGLPVLNRFEVSGDAFETVVGIDGATGRFVHLDGGDLRIELVEYEPSGEPQADSSLDRPGTTHLGVSTANVDGTIDELSDDIEILSEPQTTESGTRLVFCRDPDGTLVEILET